MPFSIVGNGLSIRRSLPYGRSGIFALTLVYLVLGTALDGISMIVLTSAA